MDDRSDDPRTHASRRWRRARAVVIVAAMTVGIFVATLEAFAVDQGLKHGCESPEAYAGGLTSPTFTTGTDPSSVSFQGWFEVESVDPINHDQAKVQWAIPDPEFPEQTVWNDLGSMTPSDAPTGGAQDRGLSNNGPAATPSFQAYQFPPGPDPPPASPPQLPADSTVQVRFLFSTIDQLYQGFRGVGIDDVLIDTGGGDPDVTENFDSGTLGAWTADRAASTGAPFWQPISQPGSIVVKSPQIAPDLVTLPAGDSGALPISGSPYAWFGDQATGTYCGPDYANRVPDVTETGPVTIQQLPKRKTLADLDPPKLGVEANIEPAKGTVLVGIPAGKSSLAGRARASQKGIKFVPLEEARQVPIGSFLDTRKGTVRLQNATGAANKTQQGTFTRGLFQVLQSRKKRAKGLTDLVLKGANFNSCKPKRGKRAQAALSRKALRRLSGNARGRYRTRGRYGAATVRGTKWTVTDRCDGTLTEVTRGKVAVRDFRRKKTILVKAGKSYLAKAPK
jgi:hypothetical protein